MEEKRANHYIRGFFALWSLFQLAAVIIKPDAMILRPLHAGFILATIFLLSGWQKPLRLFLAVASMLIISMMLYRWPIIAGQGGWVEGPDLWLAAAFILLLCLAMAKALPGFLALALLVVSYLYWGAFLAGPLGHAGFGLRRLLAYFFWGSQGIFGIGAGVSATYLFLFVLFGAFLKTAGFSAIINDMALALVGHRVGGPAKVAVIASAFMGMINGSAVANVATTGTLTIPFMCKAGYRPRFAAAIEAAASTGGQFMPPIMGAVAFVMAEFLAIPYKNVILLALMPALLYYFSLFIAVHLEAKKEGLAGFQKEHLPQAWQVFRERGFLLLPLPVLIILLFLGYTPMMAALWGLASVFIATMFKKDTRMQLSDLFQALEEGARMAAPIGLACLGIGFLVGTVSLSGFGLSFADWVLSYSHSSLLMVAVLTALLAMVLGMGVPGVAAYVIVSGVAAPLLINQGTAAETAHLFCLYYACLANITPPVALAAYVAAGIAHTSTVRTGFLAMRLGLAGFLLPLYFLFHPELLAPAFNISFLQAFCTVAIALYALTVASVGWRKKAFIKTLRPVWLLAALALLQDGFYTDVLGFASIVLLTLLLYKQRRKEAADEKMA